jgi:adenylate kinase
MTVALDYMRKGALVPDSTVWEMVRERSGCLNCRGGFILDGFPRTLAQAESLRGLIQSEGWSLSVVVNDELPVPEIVERLSGRRTCAQCKAVYHVTRQPSRVEGTCGHCSGRLVQREDDRPEAITVRMEAYERSTAPLIDFDCKLGLLVTIPAIGSP